MNKWIAIVGLVLLALLAWVGAGPFMTINDIRQAIQAQDAAAISRHVDFPAIRQSLKAQVEDYVVRRAGPEAQSSLLGSIALRMASGATGGLVDAAATPAGLAALLEGRNFWHRLDGSRSGQDAITPEPPHDPLAGAHYRFESPSRFTATVMNADGDPVIFVLTRQGFTWKVTDVRLPM
ncbi:DUF2939 domain-containing protein [Agrilutibacter solisilvae]|uniref:DUF2939 domain-containing protein n=1 Tax=Agrilutibacter solisilvae TaxID=2763317 RepID=A0A974XX40_9GAMM|nr:DUF2939 domain-containing protein [Lysobacter solisilvae]QSX77442.1 DUF2939 domain-containing protein [Lysobacter solisilvae]